MHKFYPVVACKKISSFVFRGVFILLMCLGVGESWGQISVPNTTAITENFDGIGTTATAALPSNWKMSPGCTTNATCGTTSPIWSSASNTTTTSIAASSGSPASGGRYNWGNSTTTSDRAIGFLTSGGYGNPNSLMSYYRNTNTVNLIQLTISYNAERYKINTAAASIQFYYSLDGSTWIAVTAGDISASTFVVGTGAIYSFTPAGTPTATNPGVVSKTGIVISSLNIAANSDFYLRWNVNTTGTNSQGIGIDDISIAASFAAAATAPTVTTTTASLITTTGATLNGTINANASTTTASAFNYGTSNLYGSSINTTPSSVSGSTTTGVSAAISGLTANTLYHFDVAATNGGGTTNGSDLTFTTLSNPPVIGSGTSSTTSGFTANWSAPATQGTETFTYTIDVSTDNTFATINQTITGIASTSTSTIISGLASSTTYYYRVKAVNITGSSVYSATSSGVLTLTTATPTIATSGTLGALTTTYGTASGTTTFSVSGSGLTNDILITPPAGFEISLTAGTGYATSLTLTQSGGTVAATTIYVRLAATTAAGTYSGNVVLTSTGATPVNVATASSLVNPKALTITGLGGVTKVYDGTTTAALTGTATLNGVLPADAGNVILTGSPSAAFSDKNIGTKAITVTGYTLSGSAASNYTLTQPTGLSATITAKALTISGAAAADKVYDGTTAATITGILTGIIGSENVTFSGTGTFASANAGTNIAVTSTSTLGGTDAGNYTLTQPASLTADIAKADQTITFGALANRAAGSGAFAPGATSSSGLTITYSSSNTSVATAGTTVTPVSAGATNITASQAGNANYNAAVDVVQPLTVTPPLNSLTSLELGTTNFSTNTTGSATFTTKDTKIASLPALTLTTLQQGQAGGTGYVSSKAWNNATQNTAAYWAFTITASPGYTLSVTSITLKGARSGTGPINFALRSDADAYGANIASISSLPVASNIAFTGVTLTGKSTIAFRVYGWGASGSTGTWRVGDGSAGSLDIDVQGYIECATPSAFTITGGGLYCFGSTGAVVGLNGSEVAINYQLQKGGINTGSAISGTGSAISFGNQTAGTYTVVATNTASGCSNTATMTGSVTTTERPSLGIFNVTGGGSYCSGGAGVAVGLSGSETSVNYQLLLNGTNTGAPIAGTGSAINFGNEITSGTYTVTATNTTTLCSQAMTGSVSVSVNPLPIAYNVTGGGSYCAGGSGVTINLSGSQTGVNYQLQVGAVNTGSPVAGTGASITFGNQVAAGTYTVVATNTTTLCTQAMSGSASITINPVPNVSNFTITATSPVNAGSASTVTINSSTLTAGTYTVTYNLTGANVATGSTATVSFASGTGSFSTGALATAGNTTVTITSITDGTCPVTISAGNTATINVVTLSITTGTISGAPFCINGTGVNLNIPFTSVGVYNAGNVYTAQLSDAAGSFASAVNIGTITSAANTGTIAATIPAGTAQGTGYRIRVVASNPLVTGADNGTDIIINQAVTPSVSITNSPSGTICAGTNVTFTATPVFGGTTPTYQWQVNGANTGTNSSTYSTTTLNNGDVVTVILTSNAVCTTTPTATSNSITETVTTQLTPAVTIGASPSGAVCAGTSITYTATPSNEGATPSYQWRVNGANVAGETGTTFTSSTLTNGNTVDVVLTSSLGCVTSATATSNIITVAISPNTTITLTSAAATANQSVTQGVAITNITYAIANGTGASVTGLPAGVTGSYSGGTFTISGIPTEGGKFNYTITGTGGCSSPTATGTITVNPLLVQSGFTSVITPLYMAAAHANNRIPVMYRATVSGLGANTTYRYYTLGSATTDFGTATSGAGVLLLVNSNGTTYTTSSLGSTIIAGEYETFTTDASGSYTGWFGLINSTNTKFAAGNAVYPAITIADNAGTVTYRRALDVSLTTLAVNTTAAATSGSFFQSTTSATSKNLAALYNNTAGTGRPLYISPIENIGTAITPIIPGYITAAGAWNAIIPNINANGVRRIEQLSSATGSLVACASVDADGIWPTGNISTINPTNGAAVKVIDGSDDPIICVSPEINVQQGSTNYLTGSTYSLNTTVGTNGDIIFTIQNLGVGTLNISNIVVSGTGFTLQGTAPTSVADGSSATFTVRFSPVAATTYTGTITITNDDADEGTYVINLSGTGVSATVTTGTVSGSPFCATTATAISVPFTSTGTFNPANVYTAQLSDAAGAFGSPVSIGSLTSTASSGTISATIPAGTASGTGYRIRVVSSDPAVNGAPNGTNLVINNLAVISSQPNNQTVVVPGTAVYTVSASGAATYQWQVSTDNGTTWNNVSTGTGGTTATYTTAATTAGMNGYQFRVVIGSSSPCGSVTSNAAILNIGNILAAWDFFGETSTATSPADIYNPDLVNSSGNSNITRGAGAALSAAGNSFRTVGFKNDGISTANTDYFQVTLKPAGGSVMSLSSIDAKFAGTATYAVAPGVSSQFAYSLDGTTFTLIGNPVVTIGTPATSPQVDLTGIAALQNIPSTTNVYFRYYASGQTNTGGWGFYSGTLGSYGLQIDGTIVSPEIDITGNGNAIASGATTTSTTNNTDFGSANITTGTVVKTFTIANTGTVPLNLTGTSPYIIINGANATDFTVTQIPSNTIAASGNTTFQLTFDPSAAGLRTATVSLANNDADENPYTFAIQGTGLAPEINVQQSSTDYASGDTYTYANTTAGSFTDAVFTIQNTGTDVLTISNIAVTGSAFSIVSAIPTTVAAGSSATVTVRFNAAAIATYTGVLTITNNDADEGSYTINLTGDGVASIPVVTSASPTGTYGVPFNYTIIATNTPTSYAITSGTLPAGLSLNTSTGVISGTPTAVVTSSVVGISATNSGGTGNGTLTFTISPKPLTITGLTASNKVYNGTTTATLSGTAVLNGVVGADDVTLSGTPAANFSDKNVGTGKTVNITGYTLSGSAAGNYTLTQPTLTANITAAPLTITGVTANNKVYDGTTTAALSGTPVLNGVAGGDNVTVTGTPVANFADANVGTGKTVTVTGYTLSGTDAGNYTVAQPTGLTADITTGPCTTTSATSGSIGWNFMAGTGAASSNTASNVTVSSLAAGNQYGTVSTPINTTSASNGYTGASGTYNIGTASRVGALVTTVMPITASTGSAYYEFTLTPSAGYTVSVTSLSFGTRATSTGPQIYTLRSSLDGYVTELATGSITPTSGSAWAPKTNGTVTSNISIIGTAVTYRIYGYSGSGTASAGTENWRIDDLVIGVTTSITSNVTLTSPITASTCSGSPFTYTPTSALSPATYTWTRAAVAGISNAAGSGTGNISETLINTTNSPVNVIYNYTINGSNCSNPNQLVTVTVNPTPDVSNFSTAATSPVNAGNTSTVTIGSSTLADGSYTLTYNLTGSNVATGNTATVSFSAGTGTFATNSLASPGATTITITSLSNGTCSTPVSSNNTATVTVVNTTISINPISPTSFCVTGTTGSPVSVSFTSAGTFDPANIYTAQLSDASGSFASPVSIGTLNSNANNGTINATIPAGIIAGTAYRIRVVSNNPAITGNDNGSNLTVGNDPVITSDPSSASVFVGNTAVFSLTATSASAYQWQFSTDNGVTWNNVTTGSGGTTATYTTPATTTAMNGYEFRCIVTGASPCNSLTVTSITATLTVNTAASIWTNPITYTDPNTFNPFTTGQVVDANLIVSGIGRGTGITGESATNRYNASAWTTTSTFDANDYYYFTLTPGGGYVINFSSFVFTGQSSNSGPVNYALRSSVDNYGSVIASGTITANGNASPVQIISLLASSFQGVASAIQYRLYAWTSSGIAGTFSVNDFTFNGAVITNCPATKLIFKNTIANTNQDAVLPSFPVSVACADNTLITTCNNGTITLTSTGCGLKGTLTRPVVNGVATFDDISFSRSTQTGITFTATYSGTCGAYTPGVSNTFNVGFTGVGAPVVTTLKNENFSGSSPAWSYAIGTPIITNTSTEGGTDVTGLKTLGGNTVMSKSFSKDNASGKQGSTNTVTFANVTGLGAYTSVDFSFQIGSIPTGTVGTGAGGDNGEYMYVECSIDGGVTWKKVLTNNGSGDHSFDLSSSSPVNLAYDANAIYSSGNSLWYQSAFDVTLPAGTTQFMFRMTANDNRTNENWVIDNLLLQGTTNGTGTQLPLPVVSTYNIMACPGSSNTISASVDNGIGTLTYLWTPNTNITSTTVNNPVVSPMTTTTYNVVATDADKCSASANVVVTVPSGTAGTWTGQASKDYFNCLNWANGVVPAATTDVTIGSTANAVELDATSPYASAFSNTGTVKNLSISNNSISFITGSEILNAFGNLNLGSSSTLNMTNGGTINLSGDWSSNSGTFNAGTGTVNLNGATQAISSLATQGFNNLNIAGTGVKTLSTDATINGNITFPGSALAINGNTLTLNGGVTHSGGGIMGSATSNLILNGAAGKALYFTPGNYYMKNITVNSGANSVSIDDSLYIAAGSSYGTLISNGILATNGYLTLKSDINGTAEVGTSSGSITGNVTVERYIATGPSGGLNHGKSWQLLAVPTTGQTIKDAWQEGATSANGNPHPGFGTMITSDRATALSDGFDAQTSPGPSLKIFNSGTNGYDGVPNTNSTQIYNSKGYFVFVRGDRSVTAYNQAANPTILRTNGTLLMGSQTSPVIPADKFQSIANPYASSIDMRNITKSSSAVQEFIYVWDPRIGGSYNYGAFVTFQLNTAKTDYIVGANGGGSYPPNGGIYNYIQSGQAFFMSTSGGSGTVTFNESGKANGGFSGTIFTRQRDDNTRTASGESSLRTTLKSVNADDSAGEVLDGVLDQYDNKYSNTVDGLDARKSANTGENLSIKTANTLLVIERKHTIVASDTIFLNLTNVRVQKYLYHFEAQNISTTAEGFVEDTYTHTRTPLNLNGTTDVPFTIENIPGSYAADRFRIVFSPVSVLPVTFTSIKAYKQDKNIKVQWVVNNESDIRQYEIEKSVSGTDFTTLSVTKPSNNKGGSASYLVADVKPVAGYNYYRIRSVDINGAVSYTTIVKVLIGTVKQEINIIPNPITDGQIHLQFSNEPAGKYGLRLLDNLGQVIMSKQITRQDGTSTELIKWNFNLAHGVYSMEVTMPDGSIQILKILY